MHYFGDISGNYGSLIEGSCDVVVHAIVAAEDQHSAGSCAKKAIRQLGNVKEAKWNQLPDVQKRRVADSFVEKVQFIDFQYAVVRLKDLKRMYANYHLFDGGGPNADLLPRVIGTVYSILFTDHIADKSSCGSSSMVFDTVYSSEKSSEVVDEIESATPDSEQFHTLDWGRSSNHRGIQTADCFAGMVAEHELGLDNWSFQIDRAPAANKSAVCHAAIENLLDDIDGG